MPTAGDAPALVGKDVVPDRASKDLIAPKTPSTAPTAQFHCLRTYVNDDLDDEKPVADQRTINTSANTRWG